jgi:hypothetical protein
MFPTKMSIAPTCATYEEPFLTHSYNSPSALTSNNLTSLRIENITGEKQSWFVSRSIKNFFIIWTTSTVELFLMTSREAIWPWLRYWTCDPVSTFRGWCIHFSQNFGTIVVDYYASTIIRERISVISDDHIATILAKVGSFWVLKLAVKAHIDCTLSRTVLSAAKISLLKTFLTSAKKTSKLSLFNGHCSIFWICI